MGVVVDCVNMEAALSAFQPGTTAYKAKLQRMQEAVRVLLAGIGEDVAREGLVDTPKVGCLSCRLTVHKVEASLSCVIDCRGWPKLFWT